MIKKRIRRLLPDDQEVRNHKHLRYLGNYLHDPNLWHLNRRSVSGAVAVGLFVAFVPLPLQMLLAAAAAIPLRVNLPLSVALVWVTNPLTIPPLFYFAYRLGTWLLGHPTKELEFQLSLTWILERSASVWQPLLVGSLFTGAVSGVLGFCAIRLLWRWHAISHWRARKRSREAAVRPAPKP